MKMFNKNLKYYRLKKNMSMKELADKIGVTQMAISHYEKGDRKPNMEIIRSLASALGVKVSDFLDKRNSKLNFVHGEFRKNTKLSLTQQEFIKESVEEYMSRFFSIVDILGNDVLTEFPKIHSLEYFDDAEKNALQMRKYLRISEFGPIGNLIEILENSGFLIFFCDILNDNFFGRNGLVNIRPYIIVNKNMTAERIRSTLAHELAHIAFKWPKDMSEKDIELSATKISGAFLFSKNDVLRELGTRRSAITKDMIITCKVYGISMYLLVKRAHICNVINDNIAKNFFISANKVGWKKHEPERIEKEFPSLFEQLVFRAVCENEISIQKGAELLKKPISFIEENCLNEEW